MYTKSKFVLLTLMLLSIVLLVACKSETDLVVGKTLDVIYKENVLTFKFDMMNTVEMTSGKDKLEKGLYLQEGESVRLDFDGYSFICAYANSELSIIDFEYGYETGKDHKRETETIKFMHNGIEREYIVHLPGNIKDAPLVFVLHGYGGNIRYTKQYLGFDEVADKNGFAVCYPQGLSGKEKSDPYWNANMEEGNDDIGFLSSLVVELVATYGLDEERVYVSGYSNGGFMSYTLALNAPEIFKKAAVVSGLISELDWENRQSAQPISILHIHGAKDEVIEIENSRHYNMSVEEIVTFFANLNGNTNYSEEKIGHFATLMKYTGVQDSGKTDYETWYYRIENAGHEWPKKQGSDIEAAEAIWAFFDR